MLTVLPTGRSMGRNLSQWFVYLLLVGVLVAALQASPCRPARPIHGLPPDRRGRLHRALGGTRADVDLVSPLLDATLKSALDGVIYALLTGGTFGWLWPH